MSKRTNNDLRMLQALPLEIKIAMTNTRIKQWYEEFGGEVYISFSGGKDSTVLLNLVRTLYPETKAIYIDTGLEYPEIREFVKTIDNVVWLRPEMNFKQVILKYGYPLISKEQSAFIQEYRTTKSAKLKSIRWNGNKYGRGKISEKWKFLVESPFLIGDKCCDLMKKNPAKKFEKQTGLHPIIGTMALESQQRKSNWLMYGCNAFEKKRPTSQPLSFWTEQDILEYIKRFQLPYATVYGDIVKDENGKWKTTGHERTGHEFCLYGIQSEDSPNRLQRIKEIHPKRYDFIMRPVEENGLGYKEVIDWVNEHGTINIEY